MDLSLLRVELCVAVWIFVLLAADVFLAPAKKEGLSWLALAGIGIALVVSLQPLPIGPAPTGLFALDGVSHYFKPLFLATAAAVILMTQAFRPQMPQHPGPFYVLLFTSVLGALILSSIQDLILLFLGLELLTFSLYIMAAYLKTDGRSVEAGMKYLILGSVSSALLVYGIALLYGAVGDTSFAAIRAFLASGELTLAAQTGILLVLAGLGFKLAAVPFQLWLPDVYEGAPAPVVAFLAVGSKMAGAVALMRLLFLALAPIQPWWSPILASLSVLTLLYGNLGALGQRNLKRLLGYSSIGHAGYLLMGFAVGTLDSARAVAFYLLAYLVSTLAVFLIVCAATDELGGDDLDHYAGLSRRSPGLAAAFFIALLSLAGVPPLAGFVGKLLVLMSAVAADRLWLAGIGAVNVAISLYYYLMVVKRMYVDAPPSPSPVRVPAASLLALGALILLILGIGICQAPFLSRINLALIF